VVEYRVLRKRGKTVKIDDQCIKMEISFEIILL
jgi:hypothetical protein